MVPDHENHERLDPDCPQCEAILEEGRQAYRPHPNSMPYPEIEEGLAMRRRLPEDQ